MTKRILIDASNDQETRIASIQNDIIEDFEYEVVGKKQLRGNVYLARVSRVEPVSYTHLTLPTTPYV